jgi:glycosyltransferase involved in cell wall biosynthesis
MGELLEVMPRLQEGFPEVKLYLGGVWESKELKKQAEGLGELVEFVGWLDKEGKEEYHELCPIFVLPSYFEGQPNALMEAMAAGMAVVATAVGGIPHMVKDGINGCLIAPKDSEALYKALTELLDSEDLRRRYGEAARTEMETRFSMSDRVARLCAVYERVIKL